MKWPIKSGAVGILAMLCLAAVALALNDPPEEATMAGAVQGEYVGVVQDGYSVYRLEDPNQPYVCYVVTRGYGPAISCLEKK